VQERVKKRLLRKAHDIMPTVVKEGMKKCPFHGFKQKAPERFAGESDDLLKKEESSSVESKRIDGCAVSACDSPSSPLLHGKGLLLMAEGTESPCESPGKTMTCL
jgi:hypothetical protein